MIRRRRVGKATKDSLHEKYVAKASPEKNTDACIKNMGTFSLSTSCTREVSFDMLLMISEVVASCES